MSLPARFLEVKPGLPIPRDWRKKIDPNVTPRRPGMRLVGCASSGSGQRTDWPSPDQLPVEYARVRLPEQTPFPDLPVVFLIKRGRFEMVNLVVCSGTTEAVLVNRFSNIPDAQRFVEKILLPHLSGASGSGKLVWDDFEYLPSGLLARVARNLEFKVA
ncbi:MAG: hypothetical protein MI867_24775 [Pseudomonadales bacterium]|nr:hypothetical protein [Pseudomonadales bacterium]